MSDTTSLKSELILALAQLDEDKVYDLVRKAVDGKATSDQLLDYMNLGMQKVGDTFEKGEYFIADLMFAGMIYRSALDIILPRQANVSSIKKGRIVIGVVENDIHDIGKDIVTCLLSADNFDVIDLGIDIKPQAFVNAVSRYHPDILMLSGMMQIARDSMQKTIDALKEAGLREKLYVLLGGGCVDPSILEHIDADAAAIELSDTLQKCNEFISRRSQ